MMPRRSKDRTPDGHGRFVDANGYVRVRVNGTIHYEHRFVWERAHGPIPVGYHIHHRNHDRTDNRLENLALIEGREHVRRHSLANHAAGIIDARGAASVRYRTDLDDDEIVRLRDAGLSFREIARRFGLSSHNTISNHYRRHLDGRGNSRKKESAA